MLPQRLDTTLAHKAIALTAELSGNEKRVASAIIDSFNRKTGQCDPSFDRIAHLLAISRRSVIRAVKKLETLRFIQRIRHGGKSNRNAYVPNWPLFRGLDNAWTARQKTRHWTSVPKESPSGCESCHVLGGEGVTQTTFLLNQSKETIYSNAPTQPMATLKITSELDATHLPNEKKKEAQPTVCHSAALAAAERHWSNDLLKRYAAATPEIYVQIVDLISVNIRHGATQAEVNRRGAGLRYIERMVMQAVIDRSAENPMHKGGANGVR